MKPDPLAKFHAITGAAAAALKALEHVGRRRIEVQREVSDIRRRNVFVSGLSSDKADRLAALEAELRSLLQRERELLDTAALEQRREQRLADALRERGILR